MAETFSPATRPVRASLTAVCSQTFSVLPRPEVARGLRGQLLIVIRQRPLIAARFLAGPRSRLAGIGSTRRPITVRITGPSRRCAGATAAVARPCRTTAVSCHVTVGPLL